MRRKAKERFRAIRRWRQGEIIPYKLRCNARAPELYELVVEDREILRPVLNSFEPPLGSLRARFSINYPEAEYLTSKLRQSSLVINGVVLPLKYAVSFFHKSMIFGHPETP